MPKPEKVEPVILLLCGLLVFFTLVVIYCEHIFPSDGQVFQVFSNILSGVTGALLMRVKPSKSGEDSSVVIDSPGAQVKTQ